MTTVYRFHYRSDKCSVVGIGRQLPLLNVYYGYFLNIPGSFFLFIAQFFLLTNTRLP